MTQKNVVLPSLSAAALGAALMASPLQAATTVSKDFTGNDCAGYFGANFEACTIFVNDGGERIEISPVIAKWDVDEASWETNSLYPSIDGSEFTTVANPWVYTPDDAEDPYVRYWATKAGNDFKLFWSVADAAVAAGGACDGSVDLYSLGCLSEALTVNTGDWSTPGGQGLSHITFYDSDDPVTVVPVPAAVWLFGSGLLGLVGIARRRRS